MVEKKAVIRNKAGIHCRPSSVIMAEMEKHPNVSVKIISDKGESSMHSILELLSLGLQSGDEVRICASGENEAAVCDIFCELFEREFDFPPKN